MLVRLAVIVLVFAYIVASTIHFFQTRAARRKICETYRCENPPRERPYDFLGVGNTYQLIIHLFNGRILKAMTVAFDTYGQTYSTILLGTQVLFTCDPQNIHQILMDRFNDYYASQGLRDHLFRPLMSGSIFALDGAPWKSARNLFRGVFSNTRSITDIAMFERVFQDMRRQIPVGGKPVDIQELLHMFTTETMVSFVLGESSEVFLSNQTPDKRKFVDSMKLVEAKIAQDGFLGGAHILTSKKQFHASCCFVRNFLGGVVSVRLAQLNRQEKIQDPALGERYCLLNSLIQNTTDTEQVIDGLLTVLVAGTGSIAHVLSATFWLLARHPPVYNKLRRVILETVGDEKVTPTYEQLKSLSYLRYVLNEVMRVLPPVPFNARIANVETWLPTGGGASRQAPVFVRKGQMVVFSSWGSHRSLTTYGEDARQFHPERWESIKADGFIPFILGPRACLGQHYATIQASYVIVRLVQSFPMIELDDSREWREHLGLTLSNKNGVNLRFFEHIE